MTTIPYTPEVKIQGVEKLTRYPNVQYLFCTRSPADRDVLVAHSWRRHEVKHLTDDFVVVVFPANAEIFQGEGTL